MAKARLNAPKTAVPLQVLWYGGGAAGESPDGSQGRSTPPLTNINRELRERTRIPQIWTTQEEPKTRCVGALGGFTSVSMHPLQSRLAAASGLAVAAILVASAIRTAPPEGPVRRFAASATYSWKEWLPCATAPKDALHNFTRPVGERPRRAWREPPLRQLCCAPPPMSLGGCFRAVIDGAIRLPDPLPPPAAASTAAPTAARAAASTATRAAAAHRAAGEAAPPPPPPPPPPPLDERYDTAALAEQVHRVLASRFGVRRVTAVFPRLKTAFDWRAAHARTVPAPRWGELHAYY